MLVPDRGPGAPRYSARCGGPKVAPGGRAAGAVGPETAGAGDAPGALPPGPGGGLCPWDWSPLHRGRGGVEEGVARKVPFSYLQFSLLLLRSNYVSRGCSGADIEFAGKWSAFAERADFVTGQHRCCCALGLLGAGGDAVKSRRREWVMPGVISAQPFPIGTRVASRHLCNWYKMLGLFFFFF